MYILLPERPIIATNDAKKERQRQYSFPQKKIGRAHHQEVIDFEEQRNGLSCELYRTCVDQQRLQNVLLKDVGDQTL